MSKQQEYTIRAGRPGSLSRKTILGRFIDKTPKMVQSDQEWTMKSEMFDGAVSSWAIENSTTGDVFKGRPEGGLTGSQPSNYFILIKEKGDFVAVPVDEWVTFRQGTKRMDLSLEDAEAAMKHRRLQATKEDPVSAATVAMTHPQTAAAEGEPDSDEEWKDVKVSYAWRMKGGADEDEAAQAQQQATALDFKDEYKPQDAEDWEHEIAADDDDLDMGDGSHEEDGSDVHGNHGPSPSVSGDEGEVSDGGMGDSLVRQKMKRVLRNKENMNSDSEGMSEGDDDEDEDDDDVDALDAMASAELPIPATTAPEALPEDKKRKPVVRDEDDSQRIVKRKRAEDIIPKEGVPSEDEIKELLEKEQRMLLADIAAAFKKRLKSADDKKMFTSRVKAVAMLDPRADPSGKRYLILRK